MVHSLQHTNSTDRVLHGKLAEYKQGTRYGSFVIYLTALNYLEDCTALLVSNKAERIWKEAALHELRYLLEWTDGNHESHQLG